MNPIVSRLMALLDILRSENQALETAQLPHALALLPQKQAATEALTQAVQNATPKPHIASNAENQHHHLIEEFSTLTARNAALLQRAISAQRRVVELLTAPPPEAEPHSYGQKGGYTSTSTAAHTPFFINNA
ncbi:flagellar protein FlgN [Neokomagataea anthophila]|uniref:Flagellar protein FlgN n=1 Tax=Neokomagataea anthophila TaxID=2826925 RepID=A0ABS5E3Q4_9PROT|nr:flagellar protein FlgN [Neokomagataea anthophila]MBR0558528.1 flagellar protein FlgN [Neokomagataea anthophila]